MEYHGKLYGKLGLMYFDTGKTSDDWDALEDVNEKKLYRLLEFVDKRTDWKINNDTTNSQVINAFLDEENKEK